MSISAKLSRLLLAVIIGFSIVSCDQDKFDQPVDSNIIRDGSIGFFASDPEKLSPQFKSRNTISSSDGCQITVDVEPISENKINTRSTLIGSTDALTTMGITGYLTVGGNFSSSATANYLVNEEITKSDASWSYANKKFWPANSTDKVSFFAYAPYVEGGSTYAGFDFAKSGVPNVTYTSATDCSLNCDLMVAMPLYNLVKPVENKPIEFKMKHVLSSIGFTVTGTNEQFDSIKFVGVYRTGTLSMDITTAVTWQAHTNLSTDATALQPKINGTITASSVVQKVNTEDGYVMVIPQTIPDNAEMILKLGDTEVKRVNLKALLEKWEPGMHYTYNLSFKAASEVDPIYKGTNCYLLTPPTADSNDDFITYKLPIHQVNRFWGSGANYGNPTAENKIANSNQWNIGLLWQDVNGMVKPVDTTDPNAITITKSTGIGIEDYFEIRVPKGAANGNFLVGISKNGNAPSLTETSSGVTNILWSWHIWVTDYDPYKPNVAGRTIHPYPEANSSSKETCGGITTTVPGGNLYTYTNASPETRGDYYRGGGDVTVWLKPPFTANIPENSTSANIKYDYILDRNVGARAATNSTSETLGMLTYQYGRKDPFPSSTLYDMSGNSVAVNIIAGPKTMAWSVQHPLHFITAQETWGSDHGLWCSNIVPIVIGSENSNICWLDASVTGNQGKSLFDPSPQKFRLPVYGTFSGICDNRGYATYDGGFKQAPVIFYYLTQYRSGTIGELLNDYINIWYSDGATNYDYYNFYIMQIYLPWEYPDPNCPVGQAMGCAIRSVK